MMDVDRFLFFVLAGLVAGSLLALIRYGREAVRLLAAIEEKLDDR